MTEPNTHETNTSTNSDSSSNISHSFSSTTSSSPPEDIMNLEISNGGYPEKFSKKTFEKLSSEREEFSNFIAIDCDINFDNEENFRDLSATDTDTVNNQIIEKYYKRNKKCLTCYLPRSLHISSTPVCGISVPRDLTFEKFCKENKTPNGYCRACLMKFRVCLVGDHINNKTINGNSAEPEQVTLKFYLKNIQNSADLDSPDDNNIQFLSYSYSPVFENYLSSRYKIDYASSIYIRKAYKDIYKLMTHDYIITGVPGIGKSAFLHYILYKHLESSNRQKSFVLSLNLNKFKVFKYDSHSETKGTTYNVIDIVEPYKYTDNDIEFCILDYEELEQTSSHFNNCKIWYLCSPNEERYKKFKKQTKTSLYLPVWTFDELKIAFSDSIEKWEEYYNIFGGIPRSLIKKNEEISYSSFYNSSMKNINDDIQNKGYNINKNYIAYRTHASKDSDINYSIIHIHPSRENNIVNYEKKVYSYASTYVLQTIGFNCDIADKNLAISNINSKNFSEIKKQNDWNQYFQDIFLYINFPNCNYTFSLLPKQNKDIDGKITSYCETLDFDFSKIKETVKYSKDSKVEKNTFYIPVSKTFPSVDAFFLSKNTLYMFQVTTGNTHPISFTGLSDLLKIYKNFTINSYKFIFVIPQYSKLNTKQSWTPALSTIKKKLGKVIDKHQQDEILSKINTNINSQIYEISKSIPQYLMKYVPNQFELSFQRTISDEDIEPCKKQRLSSDSDN